MSNLLQALSDEGALSISAYVTHPVFPNQSWKRFTETPPVQLDAFWITDSIPHAYEICRHRPFQLISVADAIVDYEGQIVTAKVSGSVTREP